MERRCLRARRRKESVYLELTGRHGRVGLAVLACESGARWSSETQSFLRKLARRRRDMNLHHFRTSARLVAAQTEHDLGVQQRSGFVILSVGVGSDGPTPSTSAVVMDGSGTLASCEVCDSCAQFYLFQRAHKTRFV